MFFINRPGDELQAIIVELAGSHRKGPRYWLRFAL